MDFRNIKLGDFFVACKFPIDKIKFKNDHKLFDKDICIYENIFGELICSWFPNWYYDYYSIKKEEKEEELESERESIFENSNKDEGWMTTSNILNVKIFCESFIDNKGKPKMPNIIAGELFEKIKQANNKNNGRFEFATEIIL
jgi:hypothetical protein